MKKAWIVTFDEPTKKYVAQRTDLDQCVQADDWGELGRRVEVIERIDPDAPATPREVVEKMIF